MPKDKLTLDHIIDIYIRGTTIDDLRDEIASTAYGSGFSDATASLGITAVGSKASHDDKMVRIADRIPKRYACTIIDEIKTGFHELRDARPIRYETVVLNHLSHKPRSHQALQIGLTMNQFKNELSLGREYLAVRFVSMMLD